MTGYIPFRKTVNDMQELLKTSVLTGEMDVTPNEVIQTLRSQSVYNLDWVIDNVTKALTAETKQFNCVEGDGTELVIVDKPKLDQVLDIIRCGGIKDDDE